MTRRQLGELGVSSAAIARRLADGRLIRLHRGVYAVGHRQLRRAGWWLAAVLATGPGAALSHRDAAALHGLRPPGDHARVDVTTPARAASTRAIRVHRTSTLVLGDVTTCAAIPVTTVARTLVDVAAVVSPARLATMLAEAERLRVLDVAKLERALRRTRARRGPGHAAMRAALETLRAGRVQLTRSELEERFLALVTTHRLPPPLMNHVVCGIEVDAWWPSRRVVVELDGFAYHATTHAFQRDRDRGNLLGDAGLRLLRFTHDDVRRRPAYVADTVRGALVAS